MLEDIQINYELIYKTFAMWPNELILDKSTSKGLFF